MIKGQCHCKNVRLSIAQLTKTATSCTCSICSRYAAVWGYFKESDVDVSVDEYGISSYSYGDKLINFNYCNRCGCITHYTSTKPTTNTTLAVNYRMFDAHVLKQVKIKVFDGADTWQYLD